MRHVQQSSRHHQASAFGQEQLHQELCCWLQVLRTEPQKILLSVVRRSLFVPKWILPPTESAGIVREGRGGEGAVDPNNLSLF